MGINVNGLRFLLYTKSKGVDFSSVAMIGRQGLHLTFEQFCTIINQEFGYKINTGKLLDIYNHKYCDELLKFLGANIVHSFDYSFYEGSSHVQDFNLPIDNKYFYQYSLVIEGGTLEHIFNFPIAIKNCMQMLKIGGHYIGISPTNNYMGHGFYQFSPELYFRIFSSNNGFHIKEMFFHEGREAHEWQKVPDPEEIKSRIEIINSQPTLLLFFAQRLADCEIFSQPPLQSDYVSNWKKSSPKSIYLLVDIPSESELSIEKTENKLLELFNHIISHPQAKLFNLVFVCEQQNKFIMEELIFSVYFSILADNKFNYFTHKIQLISRSELLSNNQLFKIIDCQILMHEFSNNYLLNEGKQTIHLGELSDTTFKI
ncbi:hypothetical protein [Cyanobacterium aponinum]|uniref:Uncharacterized protein n=1 Tax=Cyanobacterium aponinum 0216 TaxID=2676140 RepID=A0A844GR08_9CHRO|nr:hypothetical protein [Cyanobacterium aponinum]MTF38974.1 hypothetical protein [Cyanobacterium aponinum 0216]